MDKKWLRNSFVYLIILVAIIALVFTVFQPGPGRGEQPLSLTQVAAMIKRGEVKTIEVNDDKLTLQLASGGQASARRERDTSVPEMLRNFGVTPEEMSKVNYQVKEPPQFSNWLGLLVNLLPLVFFGAILLFMMRQAQGSNNQALSFGKSRARMFMGNKPTITFVDVAGRQRGAGRGVTHDEREQTLNQILVEMDGFDTNTNVTVIAATNRPDVLDPALLRPGRFDRQVILDRPDMKGRVAILKVHTKGKPLDKGVAIDDIARQSPGFSGADLANLVNEAAILSARRNKKVIGMAEFQEALERIVAGPERKSRVISDEEKQIIAYHEGGHAVVQRVLPKCDPVNKVTIVSRGMALGYTMALPTEDRYLQSKTEFEDKIAGMLGGNAAERMIFGDTTTGSSNDIEKATDLARRMVTEFGMSDKLRPPAFGKRDELVFLGREIGEQRNYSDEVAKTIDEEVRAIIDKSYEKASEVLEANRDRLERLAAKLIAEETVDGDEFERLFGDLPPKPTLHGPQPRPTVVGPGQPTPGTAPQPNPQPA